MYSSLGASATSPYYPYGYFPPPYMGYPYPSSSAPFLGHAGGGTYDVRGRKMSIGEETGGMRMREERDRFEKKREEKEREKEG